jgi:alpha-L-fucosidase
MTHHRCRQLPIFVFVAMLTGSLSGQTTSTSVVTAPKESLARWQAMRIGMFIHWGPVTLRGTEIGWSRGRDVPVAQYDQLYRRFNPTQFDADAWVATATAAGMKYLVITTKHHDGFCLWDSQHSDYDIAATPLRRDILRELSDACKAQEMMFCTYHSICDWYHADYPLGSPGGKSAKADPNMPRYVEYLHKQTAEIIRNYGPIGIMWFDGEWESPWTHAMGVELYKHIRSLQPDILINNRVDKGRRGMEGTTQSGEFLGDYATPEQRVGGFNRAEPWESCITIGRQWAWKPNDKLKSLKECIHTLLHVVGGDGNLLLNVGPMPDGRIEPRQVRRLHEIGQWLGEYGDTVYGTRGGPFKPGPWGASTCKGNKIYLFVMQWSADHSLQLPPIDAKVNSSRTLSQHPVRVTQTNEGLAISLSDPSLQDPIVTVLELTTEGKAIDIEPVEVVDRQ